MKERPQEYLAEVIANSWVSHKVFHLQLDLGREMHFKAGQYLMMYLSEEEMFNPRLEGKDDAERKKPRAYSIASPPSSSQLGFLIELKQDGVMTPYLSRLRKGDSIKVKGPLGKFVVKEEKEQLSFIATGTGVAPFRSMINDLLGKNPGQEINLLYGFRFPDEFLLKEEWGALQKKYQNFHLLTTCSKPDESWAGNVGRVTQFVDSLKPEQNHAYLCGSESMIRDAKDLLLGKGFSSEAIHIELW